MKVHVRILSILISSTVAAMASAAQRDQEQGTAAIPPAQAAEDQAAALKMAKTQDLPLLEKADRAVIDHVLPVKKRISITDAAALKRLRTALVVRDVPPSAGESEYEISFYRGKQLLRAVWVYPYGKWGFQRPKPPHWTTGSNPELKKLLEELLGKR